MLDPRSIAGRVLVLGIALAGCTQAPQQPAGEIDPELTEYARRLERVRDANGNNGDVREQLASEYYRIARHAIDAGDEARYRKYLGKSQRELLVAIKLAPNDPGPHNQMGITLAYQGDIEGSNQSFKNSLVLLGRAGGLLVLHTSGSAYTNLAHIAVYRGKLEEARGYLELGRRRGAARDELDRIETLFAWRSGDRARARKLFEAAKGTPGYADTWDQSPLPQPMRSFEDFCAVCCRNPSCGPFMADACEAEGLPVKQRAVTRETLVEEMRLERERRARLKEIYERELSIEVEPEAPRAEPKPQPTP